MRDEPLELDPTSPSARRARAAIPAAPDAWHGFKSCVTSAAVRPDPDRAWWLVWSEPVDSRLVIVFHGDGVAAGAVALLTATGAVQMAEILSRW